MIRSSDGSVATVIAAICCTSFLAFHSPRSSREREREIPRPPRRSAPPAMATKEESKGGDRQGKKPHFFKVFLPGLTSQKLEIPPAFRKHMEAGLRFCFLMGPSGNIWSVALARSQTGSLFFTDGWKRFAEDHAMETGEFIVFIYHGAARFRVLIFDTNACEKASAFRAAPSRSTAAEAEESKVKKNEQEGITGDAAATGGLMITSSRPGNRHWSRRDGEGNNPHAVDKCMSSQKEAGGYGTDATPRACPPEKITYARKRTCDDRKRSRGLLVSQRRPVTSEEIESSHKAANTFISENPFQVITMRKTAVYLGHSIPLPHSFARSHLPKNSQKIILSDCNGNEWEVKFLPLDTTYIFSAGWRQFSLDNYLEQDDACVFEVISEDKIRVHIFRVVEEVKPLIRKISRN